MADFRGYVTAAGQTFEALAKQMGYPVTIGFIEVGDGKLPDSESPIDRTQLVHKLKQFPAIVEQDAKNPGQWVATCYIPADDAINGAGYFIREIGCKLINQGNGVLYAYRRVSDDWKPVITSGEAKSFIYKLRFIPSNGELLTPTIDPSVVLVDKEELARSLQEHVESRDHPDASETEKGFSRHAKTEEVINRPTVKESKDAVVTSEKLWAWAEEAGGSMEYILSLCKRALAEAGFLLRPAPESFRNGGVLTSAMDVLIDEASGKAFSGAGPYPQEVKKGTDPMSGGFTLVEALLRDEVNHYIAATPAYVDAYKVLAMTDTDAIDAAMSASEHVVFSARKYTYTKELVSTGHTLVGAVGETWSATGTIIEFDIPETPESGFAYRNTTKKGFIQNIRFIQKNWKIPLNGMKVDRLIDGLNVEFSYFNGHGGVLTSTDSVALSCYHASLKNPAFAYNAKHGLVLGGAANAVVIDNPRCNWNGSPAYGVKPTVAGNFDGLYSGGKNSEYPGNPNIFNDPQGVVLIGGDYSYNSRTGLNLDRFFDGIVLGGYSEANVVSDIKIRTMLGSAVVNFMAQDTPDVAVSSHDPLNPSMNLLTYPNNILIRGKSYGNGKVSATASYYDQRMDALNSVGALGTLRMLPTQDGGIKLTRDGGTSIKFHAGDVPLLGRIVGLGDGFTDTATATRLCPTVRRAGNNEGDEAMVVETASQYLRLMIANGGGANTAATAAFVPKNLTTNRSINAGGTVNASGADYAEYMQKADNCGVIEKGAICGVNADGLLTDQFDDAIWFVIKSTEPSYVGGDSWGNIAEPTRYAEHAAWLTECGNLQAEKPIQREDEPEQAFMDRYQEWADKLILLTKEEPEKRDSEEWLEWEAELENRRQRVDRIAFCGQVPCNVIGANPGDSIIPVRNEDGSIGGRGVAVVDLTFELYRRAIGTVWKVLDDGRAWVAVKIS
ncbi:phage tail protein [Aeromonas hydrophila]|uniref:phage tail protein n=1 Tax=Aeromonas hydrophila TaxID=644 RepID=UPI003D1AE201